MIISIAGCRQICLKSSPTIMAVMRRFWNLLIYWMPDFIGAEISDFRCPTESVLHREPPRLIGSMEMKRDWQEYTLRILY